MDIDNLMLKTIEGLLTLLVLFAAEYLRRKLGTERIEKIRHELETKKELAEAAVRFVEQVYIDQHGADKLMRAEAWLSGQARARGLKITAEEIDGLIHSALREIKDTYGNSWADQGEKSDGNTGASDAGSGSQIG